MQINLRYKIKYVYEESRKWKGKIKTKISRMNTKR